MISLLLVAISCGVVFGHPGHGKISNEEMDRLTRMQLSELREDPTIALSYDFYNPSPEDIEFRLYTSTHQYEYTRLITNDTNSVDSSSLDPSLPMVVVAHGYTESANTSMWMHHIKDKWMKKEPMNVILVEWYILAASYRYDYAANNARFVGTELAKLLKFLQSYTGLPMSATHIIGFSLGAHLAGVAGYHLDNLARITGLDPAGPLFYDLELHERLDPLDAEFVDVIHTNAGAVLTGHFGFEYPVGHVDFFMNGGSSQNGCPPFIMDSVWDIITLHPDDIDACSHGRAHEYYVESLDAPEPSFGFMCEDYDTFETGHCLNYNHNSVGYAVTPDVGGVFYIQTQAESTFLTRSISVGLTVGEGESTYHGQVFVDVYLPGRDVEEVEMISGWTGVHAGSDLTKLVTIPSGTALGTTQISVQYRKNSLLPLSPNHLVAKVIEAYDAFEGQRYCVSGSIDLHDDVVNMFTPTLGSCC
ncbi:unnamed protein product, partial [Meganyctiphanes norvegica]